MPLRSRWLLQSIGRRATISVDGSIELAPSALPLSVRARTAVLPRCRTHERSSRGPIRVGQPLPHALARSARPRGIAGECRASGRSCGRCEAAHPRMRSGAVRQPIGPQRSVQTEQRSEARRTRRTVNRIAVAQAAAVHLPDSALLPVAAALAALADGTSRITFTPVSPDCTHARTHTHCRRSCSHRHTPARRLRRTARSLGLSGAVPRGASAVRQWLEAVCRWLYCRTGRFLRCGCTVCLVRLRAVRTAAPCAPPVAIARTPRDWRCTVASSITAGRIAARRLGRPAAVSTHCSRIGRRKCGAGRWAAQDDRAASPAHALASALRQCGVECDAAEDSLIVHGRSGGELVGLCVRVCACACVCVRVSGQVRARVCVCVWLVAHVCKCVNEVLCLTGRNATGQRPSPTPTTRPPSPPSPS